MKSNQPSENSSNEGNTTTPTLPAENNPSEQPEAVESQETLDENSVLPFGQGKWMSCSLPTLIENHQQAKVIFLTSDSIVDSSSTLLVEDFPLMIRNVLQLDGVILIVS